MQDSVAIVTGGNKGIGLGITKLLLKNNYKVISCGRSRFEDIENFCGLDHIQGDITNYETHKTVSYTHLTLPTSDLV